MDEQLYSEWNPVDQWKINGCLFNQIKNWIHPCLHTLYQSQMQDMQFRQHPEGAISWHQRDGYQCPLWRHNASILWGKMMYYSNTTSKIRGWLKLIYTTIAILRTHVWTPTSSLTQPNTSCHFLFPASLDAHCWPASRRRGPAACETARWWIGNFF